MTTSNDRKRELLGMPFGTASSKLRKALLFNMAILLDLHTCYRCNSLIDSIDQFSIEHKKAWAQQLDPVEAFFDLANIAFSHISCNVGAATRPNQVYENKQEQHRQAFRRYYDRNSVQFLERKRERYHRNK